ncbi:MAG TPA: WecB/TagA/CpsF family glycosyltransferase, partial [Bordetella sp.]|uniref:WecB/TagA/CpsF family glycosyltransferase n=1 Tax=Bordetella sp. TaxID=28081 RepID=UPI002ECFB326
APTLPGGIILCAGMAMMFAIGMQRRAPLWMQRSGLEWLWRMGSEPRRMVRRYLVEDVKFLGLFWREWRRR